MGQVVEGVSGSISTNQNRKQRETPDTTGVFRRCTSRLLIAIVTKDGLLCRAFNTNVASIFSRGRRMESISKGGGRIGNAQKIKIKKSGEAAREHSFVQFLRLLHQYVCKISSFFCLLFCFGMRKKKGCRTNPRHMLSALPRDTMRYSKKPCTCTLSRTHIKIHTKGEVKNGPENPRAGTRR